MAAETHKQRQANYPSMLQFVHELIDASDIYKYIFFSSPDSVDALKEKTEQ